MDSKLSHATHLAKTFGRTDYLPLTPADLEALLDAGSAVTKHPGTHLFREGGVADAAYAIERGTVELYRGPSAAHRIVGRVGEGDVIGDIALFRGEPYISSARAVNEVVAYRFDGRRLLRVLLDHPVLALRWLVAGLTQLESTQRRVLGLMHRSVKERVAELLLNQANRHGEVPLSQAAMAALLAVSRQSVNEAMAELRRSGIVETGYRMTRVVDGAALQRVAGR